MTTHLKQQTLSLFVFLSLAHFSYKTILQGNVSCLFENMEISRIQWMKKSDKLLGINWDDLGTLLNYCMLAHLMSMKAYYPCMLYMEHLYDVIYGNILSDHFALLLLIPSNPYILNMSDKVVRGPCLWCIINGRHCRGLGCYPLNKLIDSSNLLVWWNCLASAHSEVNAEIKYSIH